MRLIKNVFIYMLLTVLFYSQSYSTDPLKECWNKLGGNIGSKFLTFSIIESKNSLYHSFRVWQTYKSENRSAIWINSYQYMKIDTIGKNNIISKTYLDKNYLFFQNFGDTVLTPVTKSDLIEETLETVRYSPLYLLYYFIENENECKLDSDENFWIYKLKINKSLVSLFIGKSDLTLVKLIELEPNDILGDIENVYQYANYLNINGIFYPQNIFVDKTNGKAKDTIVVTSAKIIDKKEPILTKPEKFEYKKEPDKNIHIEFEKFKENIYFIYVKEAESKTMVVEFNDFLVVVDAPLKSENGELIIEEIQKHFKDKKIKYFSFGHNHSWYIGGIRAFVHKGIKILCNNSEDAEYLNYIVNAKRTLEPDSLSMQPKPLLIEQIKDSMTISDSKMEMKMFLIGKKSEHTNDYMIYYLPSLKLLFEDDLTWIKNEGDNSKPSNRHTGLYKAIKDLNLNVETIVQSWPTGRSNLKSIFPFKDLEESVKLVK